MDDAKVIFLGLLFIGAFVWGLVSFEMWNQDEEALHRKCQEACDIIISRRIDGDCYCAVEDGWKLKYEKEAS